MPWIEVEDLAIAFPSPSGWRKVVDGVFLRLEKGERLGLVGTSGSGKSLTLLSLLGLLPPAGKFAGGRLQVAGLDVLNASEEQLQPLRGGLLGLVFQAPASALNPVMRVGRQVAEAAFLHGASWAEAKARALKLLGEVGLEPAAVFFRAYPHQLSGGQLQRVLLAAALAGNPEALLLDEPTSALDPLAQNAFLALLQRFLGQSLRSILLASHDLQLVAALCDQVVVLAEGETVEQGPTQQVLHQPLHPATRLLVGGGEELLPSHPEQGPGCRLVHQCPWALPRCRQQRPALVQVDQGRWVRCFLHHQQVANA